jgi:hypothetical protein
LWTWEDDNLRVTFYPSEKENEVQAKRTGGTYGGKATTEAKARAARENGVKGGRPKPQAGTQAGTQASETQEPKLNPTEGNGKEGKGKEVSAAAQPHAGEAAVAADPMDMDSMQRAPEPSHVTQACDRRTFGDWRTMVAHRIFWTREEDEVWKSIFQAEGWDEMTKGYNFLAKKHPAPKKIFVSMIQELRE